MNIQVTLKFLFIVFCLNLLVIFAEDKTIMVDGTPREYIIEVPSNYDGTVPYDLILVYHGMGGTAQQTLFTGFHNSGNSDKFITIYPQGLEDIEDIFNPGEFTTGWKFEVQNNRDVTFTEVLLDTLFKEYNLKEKEVYVTGISNGGYFSDILACNSGDRLAAIAPVIGGYPLEVQSFPCPITQNLPVLHLGTEFDAIVDIAHLQSATKFWTQHNACTDTTQEDICTIYSGTDPRAVVYHCEFECLVNGQPVTEKTNGCHTWPAAFTGYSFETTDMILDFFREFGLGDNSNHIQIPFNTKSGKSCSIIIHNSRITFSLDKPSRVSLAVYTLRGARIVQLIDNQFLHSGTHSTALDTHLTGSGMYLITMQTGTFSYTGKVNICR